MGKIIAFGNSPLDGAIQTPTRPEEDTHGSFKQGGWGAPYLSFLEFLLGD